MSVSHVGFELTTMSYRANTLINKPSGTSFNHYMVAFIYTHTNITLTAPSGWTLTGTATDNGRTLRSYGRVAGSSEPSSYQWNHGSEWAAGIIHVFSGVSTTSPVRNANLLQGTRTNQTSPSISTGANGEAIVTASGHGNVGIPAFAPSGFVTGGRTVNGNIGLSSAHKLCPTTFVHPESNFLNGNIGSGNHAALSLALRVANNAPTAPTSVTVNGLTNGGSGNLSGDVVIDATFNDPDPADTQPSAMAIRRKIGVGAYEYWNHAGGTWGASIVWNTGTATSRTTNGFVNGNTYDIGVAYKDSTGSEGPFSSNIAITGNAAPTVTIDSVTDTTTASPTVNWTYGDAEADPQVSYRVKIFTAEALDPDEGTPEYDSGIVNSSNEFDTTTNIEQGDRWAYVQVYDGFGWSEWAEFTFFITYSPPTAPLLFVTSEMDVEFGPRNLLRYEATHDPIDFEITDHVFERYNAERDEWEEMYRGRNSTDLVAVTIQDYTFPYRKDVRYRAKTVWVL